MRDATTGQGRPGIAHKLPKTRGPGKNPSRRRWVGRVRLVRIGQTSCTRRFGSKEVHTVPVGVGISVVHGGQHPPAPHAEERQRVLGAMGPLQDAAASAILTRTKHKTSWGVVVSPVGQSLEQTTASIPNCKRQLQVEQRHVYLLNSHSLKTGVSDWKLEN